MKLTHILVKVLCLAVLVAAVESSSHSKFHSPPSISLNLSHKIAQADIIKGNKQEISFTSPQNIQSFVLQQGQDSLSMHLSRGFFITNVPQERFQVIRCGYNKAQDESQQHHSEFDIDFGSRFEALFLKTNFTFELGHSENSTSCFGLNIQYKRGFTHVIDTRTIEVQLNKALQHVFADVPAVFQSLSMQAPFIIEEGTHFSSHFTRVTVQPASPALIETIQFNANHNDSLKLRINGMFEVQAGGEIKHVSSAPVETSAAYFKKTAAGQGLHQTVEIELVAEVKKQAFDSSKANECKLVVVDYTDNTQYVDRDELYLHPNLDMINIRVHDIERPSGQSGQHLYFLSYTFKANQDIEMNKDSVLLRVKESHLFHYRYRTPFEGLYKPSFVSGQPHFFLSCLSLQDGIEDAAVSSSSVIQRAVAHYYPDEKFIRLRASSTVDEEKSLKREIPVGNIAEKDLTFTVTIALTVSACAFLILQLQRLSVKKNV